MIEDEIVSCIKELLIATESGNADGILSATLALDNIKNEHASEIEGHLMHYLQNRSYEKALAYLQGERRDDMH